VADSGSAVVNIVSPVVITKLPPSQTVSSGGAAGFTIQIQNFGTVTLTGIDVSDPLTPDCSRSAGSLPDLAAGASTGYTCQSDPVTQGFVNTATVTASYNAQLVSDSDTAVVNLPGGRGVGCGSLGPLQGGPVWTGALVGYPAGHCPSCHEEKTDNRY
jgi:uncharacterized repeat protein (TIGR01451 family)